MRTEHCTGYTHTHTNETTTKVVHDSDIACSGAGGDNLVSAANMGISCRQTGSPGKSHHQEQRGPWSKDDPETIHNHTTLSVNQVQDLVYDTVALHNW